MNLLAKSMIDYLLIGDIGLLNLVIRGIRVVFVIEFSVGSLWVLFMYVSYKFSNSLSHNIGPPSGNCDPCATKFAAGVNLRRHDTLRRTVRNVMTIFL